MIHVNESLRIELHPDDDEPHLVLMDDTGQVRVPMESIFQLSEALLRASVELHKRAYGDPDDRLLDADDVDREDLDLDLGELGIDYPEE